MNPPITPALTPEEWAVRLSPESNLSLDDTMWFAADEAWLPYQGHRHALAALALHGQSFGFTHADLNLLSEAAGRIEGEDSAQTPLADALMALAARIESLLPPEVK